MPQSPADAEKKATSVTPAVPPHSHPLHQPATLPPPTDEHDHHPPTGQHDPVVLSPDVLERLSTSREKVNPHIEVDGLVRTRYSVIKQDVDRVKCCTQVGELMNALERARRKWMRMGIFENVHYELAPTKNGSMEDVLLSLNFVEAKGVQEIGIFTTETAVPELKMSAHNLFGRAYSCEAHYIPPAAKQHAWHMSVTSNTPRFGDHCEYMIGQSKTTHYHHPADAERIEEAKITVEKNYIHWMHSFIVGVQHRLLAAKEPTAFPPFITQDLRALG